jgi:hypothetical protein
MLVTPDAESLGAMFWRLGRAELRMIQAGFRDSFRRVTFMPRISHVPIGLTWVSLILITTGVGASPMRGQRPAATRTADVTFLVSGTLVSDDKTPIGGARVMIAEAKEAGFAISIDEGGALQNPAESTDAVGRFSIAVRRSLFKERQEFVVVVPFFDGTAQPMWLGGSGVTVKIDKTKRVYELGKIAHGNPVVR